jgi:hypothetical protein
MKNGKHDQGRQSNDEAQISPAFLQADGRQTGYSKELEEIRRGADPRAVLERTFGHPLNRAEDIFTRETELIPAVNAVIVYATVNSDRVHEVRVFTRVEWCLIDATGFGRFWNCTTGSICADWLRDADYWDKKGGEYFPGCSPHTMTPEFQFAEMLGFHGFLDRAEALRAVIEFARIDTCAWARKMRASDDEEFIKRLIKQRTADRSIPSDKPAPKVLT